MYTEQNGAILVTISEISIVWEMFSIHRVNSLRLRGRSAAKERLTSPGRQGVFVAKASLSLGRHSDAYRCFSSGALHCAGSVAELMRKQ